MLDALLSHDLTSDECVRLACALGDLGIAAARASLQRLRALRAAADPELGSEIDIALRRLPG
jgi:hypothetical protein